MDGSLSLAEALNSVLGHAVAALEHEDRGELYFSLQAYDSAWCALTCALDTHGGGCNQLPSLVRETCAALLETYSSRHEAIRTSLQTDGTSRAGRKVDSSSEFPQQSDVGRPPQLTPGCSRSGAAGAPVSSSVPEDAADATELYPAPEDRCNDGPKGRRAATQVPPTPTGGSGAGGRNAAGGGAVGNAPAAGDASDACGSGPAVAFTEQMTEVLQQCQRPVAAGVSLDDLAGLGEVKEEVRMALLLPLKMPHLFQGIRQPPRNFLLHGPPGTGKTMLVERIAAEAGATLLVMTPGAVLSKWSGESEKQLRAVFDVARAMQPCIVFMDEVDSLAPTRGSGDDPVARRLLNELLVQMSYLATGGGSVKGGDGGGGGKSGGVYVFAATNRIQDCDPALLRRFDRRVAVPLPDHEARVAFLAAVLAAPELAGHLLSGEEVQALAGSTEGYSGSDLSQLCREAAMQPVRELLRDMAAAGACRGGSARRAAASAAPEAPQTMRALALKDFKQALTLIKPAGTDSS